MPAPRSAAYDRICAAAVAHFAANGYDGASLNEIACMVGIRKASLYSHFKSKDALYLQALEDAVAIEAGFADALLERPARAEGPGASYVLELSGRFENSVHFRFLLRNSYMPPASQKTSVDAAFERFLERLRLGFLGQLRQTHPALSPSDQECYAIAYLGVVDSLFTKLNYVGPDGMEKTRKALWRLLTDSLSLCKG